MSESDRALLEMAAKAAEIPLGWDDDYVGVGIDGEQPFHGITKDEWTPLTDDGDALRLAIACRLKITYDTLQAGDVVEVSLAYDSELFDEGWFISEWIKDDPYAATRRAITRAAAEIGKSR